MIAACARLYDACFYSLACIAVYYACSNVYLKVKYWMLAKKKRTISDSLIEKVAEQLKDFKLSDEIEDCLRRFNIKNIHEKLLLKGLVTCEDMVRFFTKAAYKDCYKLNLIVEFLFEEAIETAKLRDKKLIELKKSGKELPVLFGIPISIKDVIEFKGHDTSMGSAFHCFKPTSENGLIIKMLMEAGAIPFVKTNIPQLLLINETNNWIWGRALNPWDTDRSTGGSSGGEGGIIAMGCSPLGLGSDGGGSVRIPANYCGVVGIRPTGKRFTLAGHKATSDYVPRHIYGCVGPLAKTIDDCARCLEALQNVDMIRENDPLTCALPWNSDVVKEFEEKKLRVGIIYEFEEVNCFQKDL